MKLYISEGALLLLVLFYLPVVIWILWKAWKNLPPRLPIRITGIVIASAIAVAIPLWDAAITSYHMAKLCPHAGVFIKHSVKVDGFYTKFGSPDMLDRGFKYIESRGVGNQIIVYSIEGEKTRTDKYDVKDYQIRSRYEYIFDAESGPYQGRKDIGISKSIVRDRATGEELGYTLRYKAYPGWVDRNTISRLGKILWMCPDYTISQEIQMQRRVLLPE